MGGDSQRFLPLNHGDPLQLQSVSARDVELAREHARLMIQGDITTRNHLLSIPHFRQRGVSLVGLGETGIISPGRERTDAQIVEATMAGSIQINVVMLIAAVLFDCDYFRNGVCAKHDESRPYDPCRKFSTTQCGRSKFAQPQEMQQALAEMSTIKACARPTLEEAIEHFMTRMRQQYS